MVDEEEQEKIVQSEPPTNIDIQESIDTEVQVLNNLIEPGRDVDTSKKKVFKEGSTTETLWIDSVFRNLATKNVSTSNLSSRQERAMVLLAAVARSEQAIVEEWGVEYGSVELQNFLADVYNINAVVRKAGPTVGGTLLHLARSKITIAKEEKKKEAEEPQKKKKWVLF